MPEMMMCRNIGCELKDRCYRFKARPKVKQSYFLVSPLGGKTCPYFKLLKPKKGR